MSLNGFLGAVTKVLVVFNILLISVLIVKMEINLSSNMVFYLSPMQQFIDLYNNETKAVSFRLETISTYLCKIECNYEFIDVSDNMTVDKGTLSFSRFNDSVKSYHLASPVVGIGQKVYNFNIVCSNRKSARCWFKTPERRASAIAIMNYRLRESEQSLKNEVQTRLQNALLEFVPADIISQENEISVTETDYLVNFNEISGEINSSNYNFTRIRDKIEGFRWLWDNENYQQLKDSMDYSLEEEISKLVQESNNTKNKIDSVVSEHNGIANMLNNEKENARLSANILLLKKVPSLALNETNEFFSSLSGIFDDFQKKNFQSYLELRRKAEHLEIPYRKMRSISDADLLELLDKGYSLIGQSNEIMCSVKGYCMDNPEKLIFADSKSNLWQAETVCNSIINLRNKFKQADDNFTLYYYNKIHPESPLNNPYQAYSTLSSELNLGYYNQDSDFAEFRNETLNNYAVDAINKQARNRKALAEKANANITKLNSDIKAMASLPVSEEMSDYCEYLINLFNFENSSILLYLFPELQRGCEEFLYAFAENKSFTAKTFYSIKSIEPENESVAYQANITNLSMRGVPKEIVALTINLTYTQDAQDYLGSYCTRINSRLSSMPVSDGIFINTSFMEKEANYSIKKKYNVTARVNTTLKEHLPICCVFGECERCCVHESCRNEEALFPVILLHGHAFNKEDSPTFSLDITEKIQRALEKDGYINSGILLYSPNYTGVKENELGAARNPVSIRATYYLDFNSENFNASELNLGIENYTTRLNDLIMFVRYRTGKSKVNIISHSMGSLIARRYLQIYGEDSVNKLIMISTPNRGIPEKTEGLCLISGRERECYDMTANSTFIQILNSIPLKNQTKIYNIYGSGCETDGADGDKVVQVSSAILQGSENHEIKVNCTGVFAVPHLELMNINTYPETYSLIKGILKN